MRPTRVLYVENDPALRGLVSRMLESSPEIELVGSFPSAETALEVENIARVDVALLDLALGADSINGIELGISLRQRNSNMGVVILT